jgi:hypothetical protein
LGGIVSNNTDLPMLGGTGNTAIYTQVGATAITVDGALTVTDASDATLTGATVAISDGFLTGDQLAYTAQDGITGSYDATSGILTLSGAASLADYQAVLASVAYSSSSSNPNSSGLDPTRTIAWMVSSGTANSATVTSTIGVTPQLTYADAKAVAEAAPSAPLNLPAYTGSATDLTYLHNYVLNAITQLYGVSASVFDTPTLYSTSLLRDFVHRAIYDNAKAPPGGVSDAPLNDYAQDVGVLFRDPGEVACGLASWQFFAVCEALGYQVSRIGTLNGDYSLSSSDPDAFFDAHVTTQVYLDDLGTSIIQDATFNFAAQDSNGNFLSYEGIRADLGAGQQPIANSFYTYTYNNFGPQYVYTSIPQSLWSYTLDEFSVPYDWINNGQAPVVAQLATLFTDPSTAHVDAQPGSFDTLIDAEDALAAVKSSGLGWTGAANQIANAGNYVSGFEILNASGTAVEGEWLTVSLANADFISYDLLTGTTLNGSFDQIENEASGVGPDLNPGADLSWAFNPFILLAANGDVEPGWNATFSISTPQLNYSTSTCAVLINLGADNVQLQSTGRYEPIGDDVESVVGSPFNDTIYVPIGLLATITIDMGGGTNLLHVKGPGSVDLANVTDVQYIYLDNTGSNSLVVPNTAVNTELSIYGGADGNSVDATGISAGKYINYVAGAGVDSFVDGAANGDVYATVAEVADDTFTFGSGYNSLILTNAGTIDLSGVTGTIAALYLGSGGKNFVTIPDSVVGKTLVVHGSVGWDEVNLGIASNSVTITHNANGSTTVKSTQGGSTDTFSNVEVLGFTDRTVSIRTLAVDDFVGSGTSDVLFQNGTAGDAGFYQISNGANTGWVDIGASSTAYSVAGVGDFYGSGTDDILFRDNATGDTGFYTISNGVNTGWVDIGASSTDYGIVGVGDFYGNGTDDILFRDNATGDTGFYAINNGVKTGWVDVGASSTAYSVVGTGDFYGNGTDDILFRDNATGDTGFYAISNGVNTGWVDVGASSTAYSVVGTGDFYGNGTDDILFRDNATGDTGFYAMRNGVMTGWHDIGASSTAYTVVGVGDYAGNGTDDILFRDNATGDTGYYAINNGVKTGWHDIGASSTAYAVVA